MFILHCTLRDIFSVNFTKSFVPTHRDASLAQRVRMLLPILIDRLLQDWVFKLLYVQPETATTVESGAEKTDKHKSCLFMVMWL